MSMGRRPKHARVRRRLSVAVVSLLALAGTSILGTFGALASLTPAGAAPTTWSIVPTPTVTNGNFNGVSCTSASSCTAVGTYSNGAHTLTLVEQWNGTAWSYVPSPNPGAGGGLFAVSCASASFCVAVGTGPLIEQWNGTAWSIASSPVSGGGQLYGVSCSSASFCSAVGTNAAGLLDEQWNGSAWSAVPVPGTGASQKGGVDFLLGVSCTSSSDCTAVGYSEITAYQTLVEKWNGSVWKIVTSPNPGSSGGFLAVSCTSASSCTAVGSTSPYNPSQQTLIEQWNGTAWSIVPSPNVSGVQLNALKGVSCTSASACTAVGNAGNEATPNQTGSSQTLVEQWDGTAWSIVATPTVTDGNFGGVSCTSTCVAVGSTVGGALVESTAPPAASIYAVPVVTGVSPNSGSPAGGTSITVTGTGFTGATSVTVGGKPAASVVVVSDSTITATSPSAPSVGTSDVIVTNPAGTSATSSADQFTYIYPIPAITSVAPNTGPTSGNTPLEITGTGFTGATSVSLDGLPATYVTVYNDTQITAITPALPAGTFDVLVTTPGGTNAPSSADQFTALSTPAPVVSSVTPNSGPTSGGTNVTVTGTGFTGATTVTFNGTPGTNVVVASDSKITVTSPAQVAGSSNVRVTTSFGTSAAVTADQFTYVANLPSVTSISPTSGPSSGGTSVTIKGTSLSGATEVLFGTVPATSFSVSSSTKITAVSPAEAPGAHDVTITTSSGTSAAVAADQFTSVAPPPAPVPAVTSISPTSGPTTGGTSVTIKGTGFNGATQVLFGSVPATSFSVSSSTKITAVAPAQSTGWQNVFVTTPGGTSAAVTADQFTYVLTPPVVSSLSPSSGPKAGGTSVTIKGTGFSGATQVLFGGVPATSFTVTSSTRITAVDPAGTGTVDVVVTTPNGTSTTSDDDQFTYTSRSH